MVLFVVSIILFGSFAVYTALSRFVVGSIFYILYMYIFLRTHPDASQQQGVHFAAILSNRHSGYYRYGWLLLCAQIDRHFVVDLRRVCMCVCVCSMNKEVVGSVGVL